MKKTLILSSLLLVLTGCASSGHYVEQKQYRTADVLATVVTSQRLPDQCESKSSGTGGVLLGAAVGGLIGNQFGKGSGRTAMTVAGAAVGGSAVAAANESNQNQMNCYSTGFDTHIKYTNPNNGAVQYTNIVTERQYRVGESIRTRVNLF